MIAIGVMKRNGLLNVVILERLTMINILTLKVDTKYSAEYVNRLYNSIKRNTTAKFKFYCYTENPVDLLPEICIIPIEHPNKFKLQWHKLIFHKTGFADIPIGQKCLILDIDWVILNNIDCILQDKRPKIYPRVLSGSFSGPLYLVFDFK